MTTHSKGRPNEKGKLLKGNIMCAYVEKVSLVFFFFFFLDEQSLPSISACHVRTFVKRTHSRVCITSLANFTSGSATQVNITIKLHGCLLKMIWWPLYVVLFGTLLLKKGSLRTFQGDFSPAKRTTSLAHKTRMRRLIQVYHPMLQQGAVLSWESGLTSTVQYCI